VGKWVGEWVGR